jgi:DNA-binding LacI/PurR family transcriptional regulator
MTVSRVLNGGYVSAEARARVVRAIKELDYVPSPAARSLRSGRRGCIGVSVESVHGAWFMGMLGGIEEELARTHVSMMLGSLKPLQTYDASTVLAWIDGNRIDGLIMVRFTKQERPLLEAARKHHLPVTFICPDQAVDVGFTVRCRNYDAGRSVGEHLLGLGHRRFKFAGGPRDSVDTADRLRGLTDVLAEAGVSLNATDVTFHDTYEPRAGTAAAAEYLKRPADKRATAVVLGNDSMAIAFMREMLRSGVRVPADVSVAGFDGIDEGERCWPALTTVAQPMRRLGASACKALMERIEDPALESGTTTEYPMELIVRESTGPVQPPAASRKKR